MPTNKDTDAVGLAVGLVNTWDLLASDPDGRVGTVRNLRGYALPPRVRRPLAEPKQDVLLRALRGPREPGRLPAAERHAPLDA